MRGILGHVGAGLVSNASAGSISLCLTGGHVLDVRAASVRRAAVGIGGDRIVAIGPDDQIASRSQQIVDVAGQTIVPGYIEPHGHVILANPVEFAGAVLAHGTTTAVTDSLPLMLLARPDRLAALARAGFTSCHEAVTAQDVRDRLRAGLVAMLRHSSIRPDLPDLLQAITRDEIAAGKVMLTADGPTPAFIADRGYLDHLLEVAIAAGVEAIDALRMVTVNPARYYGMLDAGEIAVGHRADLNVIPDLTHPTPALVVADGKVVAMHGALTGPLTPPAWRDAYEPAVIPRLPASAFAAPEDATGMRLVSSVITEPVPAGETPAGALRVALLDRRGRGVKRTPGIRFTQRPRGGAPPINTGGGRGVLGRKTGA